MHVPAFPSSRDSLISKPIRALYLLPPPHFHGLLANQSLDRVWIVWSAGNTLTRFQSRIYKVCALVVLGFLVIFVDMIVGRIAQIRSDGACIIGLRSFA